jgi:hypothetical protein
MEEKKVKKLSYDERQNAKRYIVLNLNCELVGVWSNLKNLCEDMKERDNEFYSYSSLSKRRNDENPIKFSTAKGEYQIYIEKLK